MGDIHVMPFKSRTKQNTYGLTWNQGGRDCHVVMSLYDKEMYDLVKCYFNSLIHLLTQNRRALNKRSPPPRILALASPEKLIGNAKLEALLKADCIETGRRSSNEHARIESNK